MTETATSTRKRSGRAPLPAPQQSAPESTSSDQGVAQLAQQPAQDTGLTATPQVGVTTKKTSKFSLPFKNPFAKSGDTLAREAAAKREKEQILQSRAKAKRQDIRARIQAKRLNEANLAQTEKVKAGFAQVTSNTEKPAELISLTKDYEMWLGREKQARARARAEVLGDQEPTPALLAEAELAEEKAAEDEWNLSPTRVRAFRPLRFDDFDKALNEVREMIHASRSAEIGEVGALMMQNELTEGPVMTAKQATEQVRARAELERRQVRAAQSKGRDPEEERAKDLAASQERAADITKKLGESRPPGAFGAAEAEWTKVDTEQSDLKDKYGPNGKLQKAQTAANLTQYPVKAAGLGVKQGTNAIVKGTSVVANNDTAIAGIVGGSIDAVSGAFKFIGQVLGFVDQVSDIRKGVADKNAAIGATRTAVQALMTLAGMAKTSLNVAKAGMEGLGQAAGALGSVGLPVVSLVTSCMAILDGVLELVPVSIRLGTGMTSINDALIAEKFPLAAAFTRINSRNAQLVEKASWKIGKGGTQLGLSIGELASGGGMGGFTGAKLAVSVVDVAHTLGHKVYDTVSESQASDARKGFFVKHEEGASRLVLKHDIAASVDLMILAARKGATYAVKTLTDYGATETEVQSMPPHLLREKILKGLESSGDPKTVKEKFDSAKKDVKDFLGLDTAIRGKDERTAMEKVSDYAAAPFKAVAKLPGVVGNEINKLTQKHADAKKLIAAKNEQGLKGNTSRGNLKVVEHMFRGREGIEKSFAKVRSGMAEQRQDTSDMRTTADKRERADRTKQQAERELKAKSTHMIDPDFVDRVTKASLPELYQIWDQMDRTSTDQIGNLQFFKHEVDRRLVEAGGVATR
jgi:hypothetical protein